MKYKSISLPLLLIFCIPGIFGEGLHLVLPHKAPSLLYSSECQETPTDLLHHNGSSPSKKKWPSPKGFNFDPLCPVCRFCSLAKFRQDIAPILVIFDYTERVSFVSVISFPSILCFSHSGRSPPFYKY